MQTGSMVQLPHAPVDREEPVRASAILKNTEGLHARPAATFATIARGFSAEITVNGVDAKSLLRILTLGLPCGATVELEAWGVDARKAVAALVQLIESEFADEA